MVSRCPEIVLRCGADAGSVLATVRSHGLVVIPGFLPEPELSSLKEETDRALDETPEGVYLIVRDSQGYAVRVDHEQLDHARFATMAGLAASPMFAEIVNHFFGPIHRFPMQAFA